MTNFIVYTLGLLLPIVVKWIFVIPMLRVSVLLTARAARLEPTTTKGILLLYCQIMESATWIVAMFVVGIVFHRFGKAPSGWLVVLYLCFELLTGTGGKYRDFDLAGFLGSSVGIVIGWWLLW